MRWILAFLIAAATMTPAQAQLGKIAIKHGWLQTWESAQAEARKTGKPIFLVFRCEP